MDIAGEIDTAASVHEQQVADTPSEGALQHLRAEELMCSPVDRRVLECLELERVPSLFFGELEGRGGRLNVKSITPPPDPPTASLPTTPIPPPTPRPR